MKKLILLLILITSSMTSYAQTYRVVSVGIDWDRVSDVWETITFQKRKEYKAQCRRQFKKYRSEFIDKDYLAEISEQDFSEEQIEQIMQMRESSQEISYITTLYVCHSKLPKRIVKKIEAEVLAE